MATTRQLLTRTVQQRGPVSTKLFRPLALSQRSLFHTSFVNSNKEQQPQQQQQQQNSHFAEVLANKFIGQVRKQRQIGHGAEQHSTEPSQYVRIKYLPRTVTLEDVHKLAREAFPNGDKQILNVVFERTDEFNMTGRCIVCMSSIDDARRLVEYGHHRTLGGNVLNMDYYGTKKTDIVKVINKFRRPELVSMHDAARDFSGRSVIISGFPSKTTTENVLGFLRSKNFFPLEGAPDNVVRLKTKSQATVSKFLVKFDSESEAWRCVRKFHNTDFLLGIRKLEFPLQLRVAY
ncbi:MAG: hypothetical protein EXX96DRAFT_559600 [Benjaminiella poitrasii]|nr:MAG: hypothetical protein EXX96DRAFT_559600 [Benjaminiella poitrasii]